MNTDWFWVLHAGFRSVAILREPGQWGKEGTATSYEVKLFIQNTFN